MVVGDEGSQFGEKGSQFVEKSHLSPVSDEGGIHPNVCNQLARSGVGIFVVVPPGLVSSSIARFCLVVACDPGYTECVIK